MAYISGSIFQCIYVNKGLIILLTKCQPTGTLRLQTTTKNFTGHTDNDKGNTWGSDTAAIPR